MSRARLALVLSLLFAQLSPSAAHAADAPEVEALLKKGLELRRAGKDVEALAAFQDAYAKGKSPRARAQVALAQQALGSWVEAEANLLGALETKDEWIEARRAALGTALTDIQTRLGSLELLGGAPGAKVSLNGEPAGSFPLPGPLRVVAGTVAIEVTGDGYLPLQRSVVVPAGGLARETLKLARAAGGAVASNPSPSPSPSPVASASTSPSSNPSPSEGTTDPGNGAPATAAASVSSGRPAYGTWGLVALGVGAVGLGTGVTGLVIREGQASRYNSAECLPNNGKTREQNCGDARSSAASAQSIATVGFIAGGVGLAASAVLLFILDSEPEAAPVATAFVGPGELGVALHARF
jgi:hypothetical protein